MVDFSISVLVNIEVHYQQETIDQSLRPCQRPATQELGAAMAYYGTTIKNEPNFVGCWVSNS